MQTTEHKYRPYGNLEQLFYNHDNEILVEGPVRTGKTRAIIEKCLLQLSRFPGSRALWVRKTKESMSESVLQTFEDHVLPQQHYLKTGGNRQFRAKYKLRNGSEIIIGGMDKSSKILSTEYDLICAFEATEITEDDWEILVTRANNGIMEYNQCIADCNPAAPHHWLNRRANGKAMSRLHSRLEDNPKFYDHDKKEWTPAGSTLIGKLEMLSGPRYLRLRKGLWAAAEGLVYDDYDPMIHVIDPFEIPESWTKFRVVDFGYVNPTVCLWIACDEDGRAFVYRELYMSHRLVEDHTRQILQLSEGEDIEATIADHDAEDRATMHRHGITTIKAVKAVSPGIESVSNRLKVAGDGRARLFLFRDCLVERDEAIYEAHRPVCTAEEFENYCYPKGMEQKAIKETPEKVDDHGMDALRYACMYLLGYYGPPAISIIDTDRRADVVHSADVLQGTCLSVSDGEPELTNDDMWNTI